MKRWKKVLLVVIGAAILLIFMATILLLWFTSGSCDNTIWSTHASPNMNFKVVTFERNCGATTGFSTHLSVLKNGKTLPNSAGDTMVIKGRPGDVAPEISWISNKKIELRTTGKEEIFLAAEEWRRWLPWPTELLEIEYVSQRIE